MKQGFRQKIIDILFIILIIVAYQAIVQNDFLETKNTTKSTLQEKKINIEPSQIEETNHKTTPLSTTFQIYFIDVGQGDSILIQCNGEYALIDAGNNKDGKKLVNYFHNLGINNFKYVIGTHPHEDHIGGMDNIIKNFSIEHFLMPNVVTNFKTFEEIITALNQKEIPLETPNIDDTFPLAEAKLKVIWIDDNPEDLNKDSIIIKITYKDTSYLLTADATIEVEEQIKEKEIQSDVLKVAHHGSKQSNSSAFLNAVKPKYAIISVGKGNDYGYPKEVVLERLNKLQSKIYRTDELGTIIVSSDGKKIYINHQKTDTNQE